MVDLVLDPYEEFEHRHEHDSTTILIKGTVDLVMGGTSVPLVADQPVVIPAQTPHLMINRAGAEAVLRCRHPHDAPPRQPVG